MEKSLKHYNILTSCDDALAKYVAISITAMMDNLQDSHVDFFLLHSQVSQNNIEMLMALCQEISNITFHEVYVHNFEQYTIFSKWGGVA